MEEGRAVINVHQYCNINKSRSLLEWQSKSVNWKSHLWSYHPKDKYYQCGKETGAVAASPAQSICVMHSGPQEPTMQIFLSDLIATNIIFSTVKYSDAK